MSHTDPRSPHDDVPIAPTPTETVATSVSEAIAERIRAQTPPERQDALGAFAKAFLRRLSADELHEVGADRLFAATASLFAFVDARGNQPSAVRVFTPSQEIHGFTAPGTILETNTDDSPFLVDSVSEELVARELSFRRLLHPVIGTSRDPEGRLERVMSGRDASHRESVMHYELERQLSEGEGADLEERIRTILRDVRLVVRDFEPMQDRVRHMIELARSAAVRYSPQEVGETVDFLDWLLQLNFVLLGYREYELLDTGQDRSIRSVPASGLGILSDVSSSSFGEATPLETLPTDVRRRIEEGDLLALGKTNAYSTVHRRARMDSIGVRIVGAEGDIRGEARLVGLFTSKAYMEPAAKTPLLHHKLDQIIVAEDLIPGSHDYKQAVELFESFPRDELFLASAEDLRELVAGLLQLEKHGGIRVLVRKDLYGRQVSIVVALPRERFSALLRKRLQTMFLERFNGSTIDYHLSLGETESAKIFFTIHVAPGVQIPEVPYEELEGEVERLARTWDDDLHDALVDRLGHERGSALATKYAARLPDYYKTSDTDWALAVDDVLHLEELEGTEDGFVVGIGNETVGERLTRVKLYKTGGKVDLSAFMPLLESLGLRAVEEIPVQLRGAGRVYVHDFGVLDSRGAVLNLETDSARVVDAIGAMWRGYAEVDSLNRLVTFAGLGWRQVQILRAYRKYRMRVSMRFTEEYRNDALAENPHIAARLVHLFEAKFDPTSADDDAVETLRAQIVADLGAVASLDQDQIIRSLLGTIEATVRTNAYLSDRTHLSLKLRSADVPEMPKPYPLYEIFVYSPHMEAIHLRGGMVARGGIRWSDRREDYRTEVLGLMKAQKVKNAVIVPDGSKGGFVLKRVPSTPEELRQEVVSQYVTFMRGLLDITDNLVNGEVVHPAGVRVLDGPDPYLVVAADKGTATFSDIANEAAERYGFWLGDAFASGGSAGYDHKALGITARGAWESVKRHFRELGVDVRRDAFTAVGIGDMSGDVFGNGMLYTETVRLIAAFDHRSVFLDPDPVDAKVAFVERQRLFDLPGSSWNDYDRSLLSPGGDVVDRRAKSVTPSAQVRAALAIPDDVPSEMTPNELIRWILRAPVDLLWNGGIGTYVKSARESHADVGDRANDMVRVEGIDLRARVVGEGGNLGFTQRGRIEYALTGGRLNTDFIDNSAGVDTSDHEVNWKILLGLAIARGDLTVEGRNELLGSCAPDVVQLVLYDNYLQAQILSQEEQVSPARIEAYEDLMQRLEADGELERDVEFLPSSEEMLERRAAGLGLTRPEMSVLLAYAKRSVYSALLDSDLPDSDYLATDLERYFPRAIVERFGDLLIEHPLRREIIATMAANDVVNSQGITFVSRMVTETGAQPADVVRAFRIARDVTGAVQRWADVEALDGQIDPGVQGELMTGVDWLVETTSRWYLVQAAGQRLAEAVGQAGDSFAELSAAINQIGPETWREEHEQEARRLMGAGVPETVARRHAFQPELVHAPDIIAVAQATGWSPLEVARGFFVLGERLEIDWLETQLEKLPLTTRWQRWAIQSTEDDLLALRRRLCERVLEQAEGGSIDEAVDRFLDARREGVERVRRFMRSLAVEGVTDGAQLTVALRQLRTLAG